MKKLILTTAALLIAFITINAQQIGSGLATIKSNVNTQLLSGVYQTNIIQTGFPDTSHDWTHLFVIRHINSTNNKQFQLSTAHTNNDRLFFRKIDNSHLNTFSQSWHELATRGANKFTGTQTINGNVGIGTTNPQSALDVAGTIISEKIKTKEVEVKVNQYADFVFADDYELPSLQEVKLHIDENKHLPGIPTEAEVMQNGMNVGEMQVKLLQKIEEMTLYMIQQQEQIATQQQVIEGQNNRIAAQQQSIESLAKEVKQLKK